MVEVDVINTTNTRLSLKNYKKIAQNVFSELRVSSYQLSLVLCGDRKIKTLNTKYRGKEKVTDVLSFPYDNKSGEVVICIAQAKRQANMHQLPLQTELIDLLIHGILHLRGYDHMKDREAKKMFALQDKLVNYIHDLI